jgi:hypothetical protein
MSAPGVCPQQPTEQRPDRSTQETAHKSRFATLAEDADGFLFGIRTAAGSHNGSPGGPICPQRAPAHPTPTVASRRQPRSVGQSPGHRQHQLSATIQQWTIS